MQYELFFILSLLLGVFMLIMLGQKLRIPYPIFLVVAGLAISLIPGVPRVTIDPELIFVIFLPPLLYEAAWMTSWPEFWRWRRVIAMLAFGLVFVTSIVVAYVSYAVIPGFTLALGFLLGGIISPPDAVAATSVLKNISVQRRLIAVLEGESLVNDASSLIVFRFALAAVISGQFELREAIVEFFIAAGMGVVTGVAIAYIMYNVHRLLPTTPSIDVALTFMTPYFMYMAAEHFEWSGVMAVVSGGLFLSYRSHEFLTSAATRMQATGVWITVTFVLNGLVFILIGLELPVAVQGFGAYELRGAIGYGLLISAVAIVVRMLWCYPIAYVPLWFRVKARADTVNPAWKGPTIVGWAGMRGVVSLASALSIPALLANGEAFPQRSMILIITFVVILVTLVFQGLTLPLVIRWVNIMEIDTESVQRQQDAAIGLHIRQVALDRLNERFGNSTGNNRVVELVRSNLESDIQEQRQHLESLTPDNTLEEEREQYRRILFDLYAVQRKELSSLRRRRTYNDAVIRRQEQQLDLDEARISHNNH